MVDKGLNYGRRHIRSFAKRIEKADIVLDLGAGSGADLALFREVHPKAALVAVESYQPNIQKLENSGIRAIQLNIERDSLPYEDESVDVIMGNQILEHCKEIWWITHEVSRVLKKNGSFIVGVPNLASLHNRVLLAIGRQPTCLQNNSAHVRGYTKGDFMAFLNSSQKDLYELRDFKGSNFYPFPPGLANPLSEIFPTLSVGIFFRFVKKEQYNRNILTYPISHNLETNFYLGAS
jgi:ubiquinone/menaquinone biosynthesis C-methylase UbiE